MHLLVSNDADTAGECGAILIARYVRMVLRNKPRFSLAMSGGSTAGCLLRALSRQDIRWNALDVFQVDERIAPLGSEKRNLTQLERILVLDGPLTPQQLFSIPVELQELSAKSYAETLKNRLGIAPVFDMIHLGLGSDGHTASLVPGDPALTCRTHSTTLTDPYGGVRRVSLTFPTINHARRRLWLVTGAEKQQALSRLLSGDPAIPGGHVTRTASIIVTDRAAAQFDSNKPPIVSDG